MDDCQAPTGEDDATGLVLRRNPDLPRLTTHRSP
jgi:hypothetical protein